MQTRPANPFLGSRLKLILQSGLANGEHSMTARLAADTMNSEERAAFPEYNGPQKKKEYLYIRNQIISVWNDNPGMYNHARNINFWL